MTSDAMHDPFAPADAPSLPVRLIRADQFERFRDEAGGPAVRWLEATGFKPEPQAVGVWPDADGNLAGALLVVADPPLAWDVSALFDRLPAGTWRLDDPDRLVPPAEAAYGWAMAAYRFERYKARPRPERRLAIERTADVERMIRLASAIALGRDLVNIPANDLGPEELAAAIAGLGEEQGARVETIVGDALLEHNFPLIHAVGAASDRPPRLVDLRWGDPAAPMVTLVGKGVCFDTGGLDLKPAAAMRTMKKDMGGAAAMTALAGAIMATGLNVRLRLLVPAVENAVSGRAFRPGDVFRSRKGITVEIGNTDAEGRLVLADALALADEENPELILDAATLTGAARVALGPELPVLFTPDDTLARDIQDAGERTADPLWRLPLHQPYRKLIEGKIAEIDNSGAKPFAGAITAALFLQSFVGETRLWAHLDIFGINDTPRPGRPQGGEATAVRPLFEMLWRRFGG